MTSIWLADLARVLATIDLTAAERADVAHMLMGTRPPAPVPAPASEAAGRRIDVDGRPSPGNPARETSPATAAHEPAPSPPGRRPAAPAGARAPTGSALLAAVRRIAGTRRNRTRTGAGVADQLTPAGRQMPATDGLHGRTLARPSGSSSQPVASAPLLSTRSSRAVIGHLLARRVEDGPLDTVAAVTMLARQQPPRSIPRLPRRTLRFGVQLLVDRSESMRPFGSDQRQLIRAVQDLVGAEITEILYFTGSPMRGVADRLTRRPRRHTATANGKPLLLLTDFGIRRYVNCAPGAPRPEWEAFFRRHTTTRLRPVALVPFRAELTPEWIGRRCRVVTWDRSTTATVAGGGSR